MSLLKKTNRLVARPMRCMARFSPLLRKINNKKYDVIFYSTSPFEESFLSAIVGPASKQLNVAVLRGVKKKCSNSSNWEELGDVNVYYLRVESLPYLKCKVFVTAKSMGAKRERLPRALHHVHVPHSLVSLHTIYPAGSFDGFDVLFAAGKHHVKEFRCLKQSDDALAYPVGYGRLSILSQGYYDGRRVDVFKNDYPCVMIAPSWHEGNVLDLVGLVLIEQLISAGFNVIVRPHFKSYDKSPEVLGAIKRKFGDCEQFLFDDFSVGGDVFCGVECLISDYSGVAYEFSVVTGNPCVFVDLRKKHRNTLGQCSHLAPFEITARDHVGLICSSDVESIVISVKSAIGPKREELQRRISDARRSLVFNYHEGVGECAVDALRQLVSPRGVG